MTISIWIIFVLIAGAGFWFYYKKNRYRLKETSVKSIKNKTNYTLTNIDQMLNHVTQKENNKGDLSLKVDADNSGEKDKEKEIPESKQKEKSSIDFKNGIIASIILKKKDDL